MNKTFASSIRISVLAVSLPFAMARSVCGAAQYERRRRRGSDRRRYRRRTDRRCIRFVSADQCRASGCRCCNPLGEGRPSARVRLCQRDVAEHRYGVPFDGRWLARAVCSHHHHRISDRPEHDASFALSRRRSGPALERRNARSAKTESSGRADPIRNRHPAARTADGRGFYSVV